MAGSPTRWQIWTISLLTVGSLISLQAGFDHSVQAFNHATERAVYYQDKPLIPSAKILSLLSINNQPAVADLLWLQTIQYFGGGSAYGDFPSLGKMVETVTQLDPKFSYPYEFGLVALPFMKQVDTAERLGLQAQKEIPGNGLLTYYLASLYHLNLKDYKKAADLYALAATQVGAPQGSRLLAAIAANQVTDSPDDRKSAIAFWETVIQNAHTDEEHDRAVAWWKQMQIVYSLEITAQQFKNTEGRFPATLQELVDKGYRDSIPDSPVNRVLTIDPTTGRVNFDKLADPSN